MCVSSWNIQCVVSRGLGNCASFSLYLPFMTLKALVKNLVEGETLENVLLAAGEQLYSDGPWSFCLGGTGQSPYGHECTANSLSLSSHSELTLVVQTNHKL